MSRFLFDNKNRGGAITGIDIQFKNVKCKVMEKIIKWMLNRCIAQNDIESVIIKTERMRQKKKVDRADFVM